MFIVYLLSWTFMIYWIHRMAHHVPGIRRIHMGHHKFIATNPPPTWHWTNLFLYQDNWISTADVWITEIIPTIIFCWLTDTWWLAGLFYLWQALIQERLEHNPNFDGYPLFTCGQWHMMHHYFQGRCNYGIFVPIWDMIFNSFRRHPA